LWLNSLSKGRRIFEDLYEFPKVNEVRRGEEDRCGECKMDHSPREKEKIFIKEKPFSLLGIRSFTYT